MDQTLQAKWPIQSSTFQRSQDTIVSTVCIMPKISNLSRCLKIAEIVSFNIKSEASYVYILSGQKSIKNAGNGPFWRVFENLKVSVKQCYQTGQF